MIIDKEYTKYVIYQITVWDLLISYDEVVSLYTEMEIYNCNIFSADAKRRYVETKCHISLVIIPLQSYLNVCNFSYYYELVRVFLYNFNKTEETLLNVMKKKGSQFLLCENWLSEMFFTDCTTVATDMCSEWCFSVHSNSVENKTKTIH
jgi:hypothetical protein